MAAPITTDVYAAAEVIRRGGLAAFATETVYGLGANALDPVAAARIFEAKQRPAFDPLIVHIADRSMLAGLVREVPEAASKLIDRFWPGPLTVVLPKQNAVPDIVTSGLETVGVRLPAHEQARELIRSAGCPVAAPSANLFGHVSPTTARHVADQLGDRIDIILDGGPCHVGLESTVVDCCGPVPRLLRPGGTTLEAIEGLIGPIEAQTQSSDGSAAPAPGMLERHYSPRTPLVVWQPGSAIPAGRIALLTWSSPPADPRFVRTVDLSPEGSLVEAAARLFAALRELDAAGLDAIYAVPFPEEGLGRAINDRLRRAAARG
ncbi:MAG TPA: L-threonylcarbamoyladenylate synthase [Caulifigura sp.]|jgi:L-threonylcarbamoyladenylate synthase|nr:L-threonylcarbamoyladenylate synthase [Caulifigura sp.]